MRNLYLCLIWMFQLAFLILCYPQLYPAIVTIIDRSSCSSPTIEIGIDSSPYRIPIACTCYLRIVNALSYHWVQSTFYFHHYLFASHPNKSQVSNILGPIFGSNPTVICSSACLVAPCCRNRWDFCWFSGSPIPKQSSSLEDYPWFPSISSSPPP